MKKKIRKMQMGSLTRELLPYSQSSLTPYISSRTLSFHYGKHHKAYVDKTNSIIAGTAFEGLALNKIVVKCAGMTDKKALFNNAAQAWNHGFYWKSMKPKGGGKPGQEILKLIKSSFGNCESFKEKFLTIAGAHFGSGWVWIVKSGAGLKIIETHDAGTPLASGEKPLIVLDIWEHAYYLDYQNRRAEYAKAFLEHLVNWDFAESQL